MYQPGPAFVQEGEIAPPQALGPPRRLPASTLIWAHLPCQSLTGQSTRSKEIIAFHWGKSDLQFRCHLFFKQLGCCADLVHPLERRAFFSLSGLSLAQACLKAGGGLLRGPFQMEQRSREGEWLP